MIASLKYMNCFLTHDTTIIKTLYLKANLHVYMLFSKWIKFKTLHYFFQVQKNYMSFTDA